MRTLPNPYITMIVQYVSTNEQFTKTYKTYHKMKYLFQNCKYYLITSKIRFHSFQTPQNRQNFTKNIIFLSKIPKLSFQL